MDAYEVIVSGHLCLDLLPNMDNVPLGALNMPGRLFEIGPLAFATGGAVSNTGLALYRLGIGVGLMASVGDDVIGRLILGVIERFDPALTRLIGLKTDLPGSYTVVLSPARADRIFLTCPGTNAGFSIDDINFSLLREAKIFHLGYPPILPRLYANDGEELETLYRQAKATGVVTSLDMSLPDPASASGAVNWPRILSRTLPFVDIFIPSIEEILFALRQGDYRAWGGKPLAHLSLSYLSQLADELLAMGGGIVGFKLGELGLYIKTAGAERLARLERFSLDVSAGANQEVWSPAYQVEVVGTTGAGDSAYAGFLSALLRGMTPAQAVQWACAVGACNVEAADALSGVRTWEATQQRIEAGWSFRTERLPGY